MHFDRAAKSPKDVALRLQNLFSGNPSIAVEYLAEENGEWRRPPASSWFAEKGGDSRKIVYRISVPARATLRKVSKMSLQLVVETKSLRIQSTRANLKEFAAPLIAAFGPVGKAAPLQNAAVDISIMKYLPK